MTSVTYLLEISGVAVLPPAPSFTNQMATIMAPFQIDRAFFSPPGRGGPFGPGNTLRGGGVATVSLFAENRGLACWFGVYGQPRIPIRTDP